MEEGFYVNADSNISTDIPPRERRKSIPLAGSMFTLAIRDRLHNFLTSNYIHVLF